MKISFWLGTLLSLCVSSSLLAYEYFPIDSVTVDTEETDLWPISNLIQGPGVGYETEEPHNKIGGGEAANWVTAADAGFPADYIEEVRQPVIQFDLGTERTLKEISVWGYESTNANGTSRFSLRFATAAEGGPDGILGVVDYGNSITYNPTFDLSNADTTVQQFKLLDEHVTARYVEFTNVDNFFIPPGTADGPEPGIEIEERLLPYVPGGDRVGLGEVAFMSLPESFQPGDKLPRAINGDEFGVLSVPGTRSGLEFSEPSAPEQGLLQEWYSVTPQPGTKDAIDTVFATTDTIVPAFRAADGDLTWWSGSNTVIDFDPYPIQLPEDFSGDQYAVRLTGEILIEESGTVQFLDGVDDYTYFAVDLDRSGVAGDTADEILINDNNWTDALGGANGGAPIVSATFDDVSGDGEWFQIEFNMAEGGGGDSGMLYWDATDEDDVFPLNQGDGVFEEDAFFLVIPESHMRSSTRDLLKADASGSLASVLTDPDVFEFSVQVSPSGNDQIAIQDGLVVGDGTSSMDVAGTTVRILANGEISEGTEFQIFGADEVTGLESLNLVLDDPGAWDTSKLGQGILVFGPGGACDPNSLGDLDGNGSVEFADFLILSGNFGNAVASHAEGDIDCNGTVEFADFLVLSGNFGTTVGGAESVPEPTGAALLSIALLGIGCLRRRR